MTTQLPEQQKLDEAYQLMNEIIDETVDLVRKNRQTDSACVIDDNLVSACAQSVVAGHPAADRFTVNGVVLVYEFDGLTAGYEIDIEEHLADER